MLMTDDQKINALEQPWAPDRERIPECWTPEHVCQRLVDAFKTLAKLPRVGGPREPGGNWPSYAYSFADVTGWKDLPIDECRSRDEDLNHTKSTASSREIANMDAAFDWLRWLRTWDEALARVIAAWASAIASQASIERLCERREWSKMTFYRKRARAADLLAARLNREGTAVF